LTFPNQTRKPASAEQWFDLAQQGKIFNVIYR